jgi:hypothetical protein
VIARAAGSLAIVALLLVPATLLHYESTRQAWRVAGSAVGTPAYDADASDAAYREVEDALVWLTRSVRACAALLLVAGFAIGRAAPARTRVASVPARRIAARAIDLATLALALALVLASAESPGVAVCLDWLAPAIVLALVLAAAANGATLGDRALGLSR